jgi:hypothetical protein
MFLAEPYEFNTVVTIVDQMQIFLLKKDTFYKNLFVEKRSVKYRLF